MTHLKLLTADALGNYVWADASSGAGNRASFYTAYMLPGEPVFSMQHEMCGVLQKTSKGYSLNTACSCTRGNKKCRCNSCDHCSACTRESMRVGEDFETDGKIFNSIARGAAAIQKGVAAAKDHFNASKSAEDAVAEVQKAVLAADTKMKILENKVEQYRIDKCKTLIRNILDELNAMLTPTTS